MKFAEVVFNIRIDHAFTYRIPEALAGRVTPGIRVLAPFGRRLLTGVVTSLASVSKIDNCKELTDVLDAQPMVTEELLQLTRWMADYYIASWGQALQPALPKGLDESSKRIITLTEPNPDVINALTDRQRHLLDIIHRNPGNSQTYYQKKFGEGAFHYLLQVLREKGCIIIEEKRQPRKVQVLMRKFITVPDGNLNTADNIPPEIIDILNDLKGKSLLRTEFIRKTGLSAYRVNKLVEQGIVRLEEHEIAREVDFDFAPEKKVIRLSRAQQKALDQINESISEQRFQVHLLHGVTGSGKTQVYLEAIRHARQQGKEAIALIPEISLTPQTVRRFQDFFPGQVAVFHSKMSLGERFDAWRRIQSGELSIVVGPRSALFMPMKNLGIIIIDEEHDSSYKQTESQPRYHARDVAVYRAQLNNATVILGSATPAVDSFYNARKGKYNLITLTERVTDQQLPKVILVDMRRKGGGAKVSLFSKLLLEKMEQRLENNEQIILLQNRRGFSSFLQCVECGFISKCPNCEITLTYHTYNKQLMCHYCRYSRPAGNTCPNCEGTQIDYKGSGTQKVEKELLAAFPGVSVLRMDHDTTSGKGAHDRILESFRRQEADILLGTQMIAKGLDFENVTLVGVISADIGLSLPDFRAAERVFQLLTQVAGRSGRGEKVGEVVVQTYQYTHFAVQKAKTHDYIGFYLQEMQNRKELDYPPFSRVINIKIHGTDLNLTIQEARKIAGKLRRTAAGNFQIIGPAPAPLSKINNQYRWHILLKINKLYDKAGRKTKRIIRQQLDSQLKQFSGDVRVVLDVDPVDMM